MKLFIDDLRDPVDDSWTVARTVQQAIDFIERNRDDLECISFDHDLGIDQHGNEMTTRRIVIYIIENDLKVGHAVVHSANPVGREWLEGMIERYF